MTLKKVCSDSEIFHAASGGLNLGPLAPEASALTTELPRSAKKSEVLLKTQLVQFVHDIISNLDGAVNRGHKQLDRLNHNGFR